jgi:SAM-dependent methyltransferase
MSANYLTDRNFWKEYWKNYKYEKIPSKVPFNKFLSKLEQANSFIEIGGFPGVFSTYFYTKGCKKVSLLDFYIDRNIVRGFEKVNGIPENTIHCIESDFFTFKTNDKYDVVFSFGFIEHFKDTKDVIQRHVELLVDDGQLLIVIPNFRGLNGFVQYVFDRKNLHAHNLDSMKPALLKNIAIDLGLKNIAVEYSRKPMIWLDPKASTVFIRKLVKLFSYMLKLFPVKCRLLSPYIIIYAKK